MSERVRFGVIGTSAYADLLHLPSICSHDKAEIAAICGRNTQRAREIADKYGIPQVYGDYRQMIEDEDLRAIVVIAPEDLHWQMSMAALDAGLHVVCEKPMAMNTFQAREMLEKAQSAGVVHMVFFTYRWSPVYRYLKQLIDDGFIGRPYHCDIGYLGGYGRAGRYSWKFEPGRGSGILGDLGSHMIDLARWLVGDIARVSCHLGTFVERLHPDTGVASTVNDSALLGLEFENGAQGSIHVSAVALPGKRGQEQRVVLHGDSGSLEAEFSFGYGEAIRGIRNGQDDFQSLCVPDSLLENVDRTATPFAQFVQVHTGQSVGDRHFIDSIIQNTAASPSFFDGYEVQRIMDAAIDSHTNSRWTLVD